MILLTALVVFIAWKVGVSIALAVIYAKKHVQVLDRVTDLNPGE